MQGLRTILKALGLPLLLHPFRGSITWACQCGLLSSRVRRILLWRWVLEPFTIHGNGWKCRWFPTEWMLGSRQTDSIACLVDSDSEPTRNTTLRGGGH